MNYNSATDFTGSTRWVYQELRDRKVALFIDKLPEGVWQMSYEMRAETPGAFHALPVWAMRCTFPRFVPTAPRRWCGLWTEPPAVKNKTIFSSHFPLIFFKKKKKKKKKKKGGGGGGGGVVGKGVVGKVGLEDAGARQCAN